MACWKIPFASRVEAKASIRHTPRLRPYRCPYCEQWHLTSWSKADVKRERKARLLAAVG
jgi:hypothetical protein